MFGYVRPADKHLSPEEQTRFRAAYCGLCRTLGRRYGLAARMILNYDLTFMAMLLSRRETCPASRRCCMAHPLRGCPVLEAEDAFDTAADLSVILTWWQLKDGVADHGFFRGLPYRVALLALQRAYRKARACRPDFDSGTRCHLEELGRLEAEHCPSMDQAADAFAALLAGVAAEEQEPRRRRVLEQLLYHLGRWIYLVDAADDLKKDVKSGSYNPLVYRFGASGGVLTDVQRQELGQTLDSSVRAMAAAFELADFGPWHGIVESVVYEGLYAVGGAVLSGSFRKKQKRNKNLTRKAGA